MHKRIAEAVIALVLVTLFACINDPRQAPGSISGFVLDAEDSIPLWGATVRIVGGEDAMTTDSTGFFAIPNIPSGEVMIQVSAERHVLTVVFVQLGSGQELSMDEPVFLVRNHGTVSGVVVRDDSLTPVCGADVLVRSSADSTFLQSTTTDSNGQFLMSFLPVDTAGYCIETRKDGFRADIRRKPVLAGDSTVLSILLKPHITVSGSVVDSATSEPIWNALVMADGRQARSDSLGRFILDGMVVFDTGLVLSVSRDYYGARSCRDTVTYTDLELNPIRMTGTMGTMRAIIHLQGQTNHCGIRVYVNATGASDTTDSLGQIEITNIPAGFRELTISKASFSTKNHIIEVPGQGIAIFCYEIPIQTGSIHTRVDWTESGSPYRVENQLEIADGGSLYVHPGVVVEMANGSVLSSSGTGVFLCSGANKSLITFSSDSTVGGDARIEMRGIGGQTILKYTMMRDIQVVLRDGPRIENCLFVHTPASESDTSLHILACRQAARLDQCDFVRLGTDAAGLFIKGSMFAAGEEADTIGFSNCVFYQSPGYPSSSPFVQSDNIGNIRVKLTNCSFFSAGTAPDTLYGVLNIDTSMVWQLDPEYADLNALDFRLMETSRLLDRSIDAGPLGALGLYVPAIPKRKKAEFSR